MNLVEFLKDAQNEIKRGSVDPKHAFRYLSLATIDDGIPQQRMVVNRQVMLKPFGVTVFTDLRSNKVKHLEFSADCSLLFWNPRKRLQVRLQSTAVFKDPENYQGVNLKDYNTMLAPGTKLTGEVVFQDLFSKENFLPIQLVGKKLDVLLLGRDKHLRAEAFFDSEGEMYDPSWLVP